MRRVAIGVVLALFRSADCDKAITVGGVTVAIKGESGKMTMTLPREDNETTEVRCEMAALRQLDANGTTLGQGGGAKHSFNSFATQTFTFTEPESAVYKGLSVTKVTFQTTLVVSSYLKIETMIFKEAGSFQVGQDTVSVALGTVKFNVILGDWTWCGENGVTCTSSAGVGDSVELDISVEGKSSPSKKNSTDATGTPFDLGDASQLVMLSTYSTDGGSTWLSMPFGYPKVSGSVFTLKFPKWNGTVLYDPLVSAAALSDGMASVAPRAAGARAALAAVAAAVARAFA